MRPALQRLPHPAGLCSATLPARGREGAASCRRHSLTMVNGKGQANLRTMKSTLAALLALTALPVAAGELVWSGSGGERDAELKLTEPGTDRIPLKFWCVKDVDVLYVEYEFMPAQPTEGMFVDFVLSAGGLVLPTVNAVGYNIEMDRSFVLEGQMQFGAPFLALLASSGPLTVTAEGRTETFSLDGASAAMGPLVEMCGGA